MATNTKTTKPAKKAVSKPAAKKTAVTPAKKTSSAKPAAKKTEAKKPTSAKKPAAKAEVKKPTAKAPAKKTTAKAPAKKAETKKPTAKPAAKASAKKTTAKATTKEPVTKKPATKPTVKKPTAKAPKADVKEPGTRSGATVKLPPTPRYPVIHPSGNKTPAKKTRMTSTTRFSDATLEVFKKRLLADRAEILAQRNAARNEALGRVDEENQEEDGSNAFTRSAELARTSGQDTRIRSIDDALQAIKNKTYGICSMCGKPIPRERLEAAPFAIRCLECKEKWEQTRAKERRDLGN